MAKLRARCKAITGGETRGQAERFGETMAEASVETSIKREQGPGFDPITKLAVRIHEDGSGLVEIRRGATSLSIRVSPETPETPSAIELYADFDGVEGMLVPAEETPR